MNSLNRILFFTIFLIATTGLQSQAQKAILFQYPSSSTQIKIAQERGDAKTVAFYKRSDNQIKHAIIKNFRQEFDYAPVYFFSSDDYYKVKAKDYDNVAFVDNKMNPVVFPEDILDYNIATIGFFPKELTEVEDKGEEVLEEGVENHFGRGIILKNVDLTPVKGKLRFTPCKIGKKGNIFVRKKRYYVFKGAGSLNLRLLKFGGK